MLTSLRRCHRQFAGFLRDMNACESDPVPARAPQAFVADSAARRAESALLTGIARGFRGWRLVEYVSSSGRVDCETAQRIVKRLDGHTKRHAAREQKRASDTNRQPEQDGQFLLGLEPEKRAEVADFSHPFAGFATAE